MRTENTELRDVENGERPPKPAERGESRGAKGVTARPFLDAREELAKAAVGETHAEDEIGRGNVPGLNVVAGEKECGGAEATGVSGALSPVLIGLS